MLILLFKAEEPGWKCQEHLLFVLYFSVQWFLVLLLGQNVLGQSTVSCVLFWYTTG